MSVPLLKHTSDFQAVHLKLWAIHVVYKYIYVHFPKKNVEGVQRRVHPAADSVLPAARFPKQRLPFCQCLKSSSLATHQTRCAVFGHIHFYKPALLFTKRSQGRGAKHTSLHNSALDIDHCVRVVTNIFVFIMVPSFITRR